MCIFRLKLFALWTVVPFLLMFESYLDFFSAHVEYYPSRLSRTEPQDAIPDSSSMISVDTLTPMVEFNDRPP